MSDELVNHVSSN